MTSDNNETEQTTVPQEEAELQGSITYRRTLLLESMKYNKSFYERIREAASRPEISGNPRYSKSFQGILRDTKSRITKLDRQLKELEAQEQEQQQK